MGGDSPLVKTKNIVYNGGKQNWPFFKTADFSINNAINPTNLGAK